MKKILGNILPYALTESKQQSFRLLIGCATVRHRVSILADLLLDGILHMEATGNSILIATRGTIQSEVMALKNRVIGIAVLLTD